MKNPELKIIGLTGRKGHGKDHTGRVIHDVAWRQFQTVERFAFGDSMKEVCAVIFGVPLHIYHADDRVKDQYPTIWRWDELNPELLQDFPTRRGEYVTVRESMQLLGTQLFRDRFCKDTWVRLTLNKLEACDKHIAVVTDVRFLSEAEALRRMGGRVYRVLDPAKPVDPYKHQSETQMDSIAVDHTFLNDHDRTADDYLLEVESVMDHTLGYHR